MAYTFVKANGGKIGNSICEDDQIDTAKAIEKKAADKGVKLVMATDVLAADDFSGMVLTNLLLSMKFLMDLKVLMLVLIQEKLLLM